MDADMTSWITHTATAFGGVVMTLAGIGLFIWRQKNSIQTQQDKDAYEMERMRRSDFGKELLGIVTELKKEALVRDKKIDALTEEGIACAKKSAMQDVEIFKQKGLIDYLVLRMKNLEQSAISAPAVANAAAVAASLIEKRAAEVASTLAKTENGPVIVEFSEPQKVQVVDIVT